MVSNFVWFLPIVNFIKTIYINICFNFQVDITLFPLFYNQEADDLSVRAASEKKFDL